MRALVAGVVLVAVAMAAVVVFVIASGTPHGDADGPPERRPSTDAEKRAARVAVAFAERLRANDAIGACAMLGGEMPRQFRCARAPRIPRSLTIAPSERLEVADLPPARAPDAIAIGIHVRRGGAAPALSVEVDAAGRVVEAGSYGYA